jgi:benzoyl-CoA reductase subunit B
MEFKSANGIGTLGDERFRLVFLGVPCYTMFRRFNELFTEWGGTFVTSTYLWFASGGANRGFQYDLAKPIESFAEGVLISVRDAMDSMFHQEHALAEMLEPYGIDGIIYHGIKSCRTVSTGLADCRRFVAERYDIPSLLLESDMMDRRVVSEAQMKNRVDAFFEGLSTRKGNSIVR